MPTPNNTFGQIWNRVLLYCPDLPPPLAQEFVKITYHQVIGDHSWTDTRKDAEFLLPDAYTTGTITVTENSATVLGSGVDFTNGTLYVGRQLSVGNIAPFYTITAVTQSVPLGTYDTLTLDRAYENSTEAGVTYSIGQYYVEFPTDLYVLERIRDQANGWYLITQTYNQEYLDRVDVRRQSTGTPTLCVVAPSRTDASTGIVYPRYELWPRVQAKRFYAYRYRSNPELVNNSDRPISSLSPEVLVFGALRQAAIWPGTKDKQNPYFSQELHATYTKMYDDALQNSIQQDMERDQSMVQVADDPRRSFPFDARYIQSHIW
jgi:hypothetical protein